MAALLCKYCLLISLSFTFRLWQLYKYIFLLTRARVGKKKFRPYFLLIQLQTICEFGNKIAHTVLCTVHYPVPISTSFPLFHSTCLLLSHSTSLPPRLVSLQCFNYLTLDLPQYLTQFSSLNSTNLGPTSLLLNHYITYHYLVTKSFFHCLTSFAQLLTAEYTIRKFN